MVWNSGEKSQSLKDQGKSRTNGVVTIQLPEVESQSLKDQGKSRTEEKFYNYFDFESQSLKDQGKSRTLWTAWHSHVDSRFHCANIRHKREEKVAGPKLIHIKSLLAF